MFNKVFFAPRYAGFLASYNSNGTQRFLVQTVDALALPKFQVKDGMVLYPCKSIKRSRNRSVETAVAW